MLLYIAIMLIAIGDFLNQIKDILWHLTLAVISLSFYFFSILDPNFFVLKLSKNLSALILIGLIAVFIYALKNLGEIMWENDISTV